MLYELIPVKVQYAKTNNKHTKTTNKLTTFFNLTIIVISI